MRRRGLRAKLPHLCTSGVGVKAASTEIAMRPFATIADRTVLVLTVGCTVFALACGDTQSNH
jgi:hypothetical protein